MTEEGTGLRVTRVRLPDGRALTYYDDREPGVADRVTARPRPEVPDQPGGWSGSLGTAGPSSGPHGTGPATAPVMRFDVLTGEWVTMAPHRMTRTHLPSAAECPLCPSRDGVRTEIPAEDYDVAVFDNRFPPFAAPPGGPGADPVPDLVLDLVDGDPLWPQRPAAGRCEVICFSSAHDVSFAQLPTWRVRTVIAAWAERTGALSQVPGVAQVYCFENRGPEIGVTLHHPHGQIYGYPFLPPRTERLLAQADEYRHRTGSDLLGDVLAAELRAGTRVVHRGSAWSAYVPAAARWPLEVHLVPHRAVPDFTALTCAERAELARLYPDLLRRVDAFFGEAAAPVPYVASWHQAPVGPGRDLVRLHLQLFSVRRAPGKLKYLAASEAGMGAWLNDTTPERIAARLRELGQGEAGHRKAGLTP